MAASLFNFSTYSRFNLSETESDIQVFVREYGYRIKKQLAREEEGGRSNFVSFAEKRLSITDLTWLHDNQERFFKDTPNENLLSLNYLSQIGFICSMIYSTDGKFLIVGHSTGLIQMRHGSTGVVLCTLRNIQFPPKPVYALQYSRLEERVCYAACNDGAVYRIEIPNMDSSLDDPPEYCIKADPALECLNTQYYGSPGISSYATPFITQRSAALALGLMADQSKMAVGYSDTSIKVYDMETVETITMYKVQKVRLQLIPKKLQRMHSGQVCALRCHDQNTNLFASGAWDKTLRIWDVRCKVGCVMTFEGVNICADSIDLNRDHCIVGSWQPTEAFTVWDLVAKKKLHTVRVQNRRPDVDGEYIYACRYWRSKEFNRKGKYGIIGGSGTNCVEIINLHNRYIACSYPAPGTVLAITSHNDKIAFGGTAPVLNIVSFHDPKHEECKVESETEYDYTVKDPTWDDKSMTEALESTSQAKSTISNITRSLDRGAISTINQQATPPPSC
ncbi:uncharacterized protein LOC123880700 isoform X1 [Maniola jurtina]|uniref:uncharacterized protein LOC123880700 isoform X1 n=1 Tax=Maniola jurtina TaxID=191418 RepID=UPI001E68C2CD|nr:uncharacterized protein LOC123880700 isoform X1 [Maniola jurtina]